MALHEPHPLHPPPWIFPYASGHPSDQRGRSYPGARRGLLARRNAALLPSILLRKDEMGQPCREEFYPKTTGSQPISDKAKARDTSLGSGIQGMFLIQQGSPSHTSPSARCSKIWLSAAHVLFWDHPCPPLTYPFS